MQIKCPCVDRWKGAFVESLTLWRTIRTKWNWSSVMHLGVETTRYYQINRRTDTLQDSVWRHTNISAMYGGGGCGGVWAFKIIYLETVFERVWPQNISYVSQVSWPTFLTLPVVWRYINYNVSKTWSASFFMLKRERRELALMDPLEIASLSLWDNRLCYDVTIWAFDD